LVMGIKPLYPQNVAWLNGLDPIQHYIGWAFYRFGPWSFPVGLNPAYGMELSSSIVYTDSIPLLAILFKPFSALLPETFQYLGIWTLVCFVLQAYFAGRLMSLITSDRLIALMGSAFFVFSPPMLWRMGYHTALASHFLILAALYLNLRPDLSRHIRNWALVIVIASLVHFYILAMVMALWIADLLDRSPLGNKSDPTKTQELTQLTLLAIGKELIIVLLLLLGAMWQAGYFSMDASSAMTSNFGVYGVDLLSLFTSSSWSYLPSLAVISRRHWEVQVFLGTGLILVALFSICRNPFVFLATLLSVSRFRFLLLISVLLTLFALSNQIVFGSKLISVDVPEAFFSYASILRYSSRMFWPVYYLLAFFLIASFVKSGPRKINLIILFFALVVQIIDTSSGWLPRKNSTFEVSGSALPTFLKNEFWNSAANQYREIVRTPYVREASRGWFEFADIAAARQIQTNIIYLARYSDIKLAKANQTLLNALYQGQFNPQTLYILDDSKVLAAQMHIHPDDLLARIDGLNVLAPGWKSCKDCLQVPSSMEISSPMPTLGLAKPISFGAGSLGPSFLIWGWAEPESWGAWSIGKQSKLVMPMPRGAKSLTLDVRALIGANHATQELELMVNGVGQGKVSLSKPDHNQIPISLAQVDKQEKYVAIQLNYINPVKPKTLGQGPDERDLAIGINSAVFE